MKRSSLIKPLEYVPCITKRKIERTYSNAHQCERTIKDLEAIRDSGAYKERLFVLYK